MIPENRLSTTVIYNTLMMPDPQPSDLVSRQMGGVALNDPTQGLWIKPWTCDTVSSEDPLEPDLIRVFADDVPPETVLTDFAVTQVSLAFDQNMRPTIAFVANGVPKLYWYDSALEQPVVTTLASGVISPRVTLDDHRRLQDSASDIILTYIRDGNLYFCMQRDRYTIEYLLKADINLEIKDPYIISVAMNNSYRLQWNIRGNFYGG